MKLPEISIDEWLKAEETLRASLNEPQPKGYITPDDYASMRGCTPCNARKILAQLVNAGLAERIKWLANGHVRFVYKLKK
jgi:hypothetical protein